MSYASGGPELVRAENGKEERAVCQGGKRESETTGSSDERAHAPLPMELSRTCHAESGACMMSCVYAYLVSSISKSEKVSAFRLLAQRRRVSIWFDEIVFSLLEADARRTQALGWRLPSKRSKLWPRPTPA